MSSIVLEDVELDELKEVVSDPEKAREALPEEDQEAYRQAQQSVVDARRLS